MGDKEDSVERIATMLADMDRRMLSGFRELDTKIVTHSRSSLEREKVTFDKLNRLEKIVQDASAKADVAHAIALEAKHEAGRVSMSAEGNDHSIFADLASLKVVMGEHTAELAKHRKNADSQAKLDAKARRFWRLAGPVITGLFIYLIQFLANVLHVPAPPPPQLPTHEAPR